MSKTTHGLSRTKLYQCWRTMKQRCYNANNPEYKRYGARGITVCVQWLNSFEHFFADMGHPSFSGATIDRINVNGNYEKENCRWATRKEQQNNKRSNHVLIFRGESRNVTEWAELLGLPAQRVFYRLGKGWNAEDALLTPIDNYHKRNGIRKRKLSAEEASTIRAQIKIGATQISLARKYGVSRTTIQNTRRDVFY